MKDKINKQETSNKNKNIRVLSSIDKLKVYQARTSFVRDDMGDMLQLPTAFYIGGRTNSVS